MSYKCLVTPSQALIQRVEICNLGLPGNLSDILTSREANGISKNRLVQRSVFKEEHDVAVRKLLNVPETEKGTFGEQIRQYLRLKARYVHNVLGYGNFILDAEIPDFVRDVEEMNNRLKILCRDVRLFLNSHFRMCWSDILRFNPRVRYATFILTEQYVRDEGFVSAVRRMKNPIAKGLCVEQLLGLEDVAPVR